MKINAVQLSLGGLIWLLASIATLLLSPMKAREVVLFESLVTIVLVLIVVFIARSYFQDHHEDEVDALKAGLLWMVTCWCIDIALMLIGINHMSFNQYVIDVGLVYVIIPIITYGMGSCLISDNENL